jgi:hypothetical protein
MLQVIACPDPTCQAAAQIVDRWTWQSTDGPVEHVKTACEHGRFGCGAGSMPMVGSWLYKQFGRDDLPCGPGSV